MVTMKCLGNQKGIFLDVIPLQASFYYQNESHLKFDLVFCLLKDLLGESNNQQPPQIQ